MPVLEFDLNDKSSFDKSLLLTLDATRPSAKVQVLDEGVPQPLTAATVTFAMDDENGVVKVNDAAAVIEDKIKGIVRYDFIAGDVDTEGLFFGQFTITLSGGGILRVPNNSNQKLRIVVGPRVN